MKFKVKHFFLKVRIVIARFRCRFDVFYRLRLLEKKVDAFLSNFYYELEDCHMPSFNVMNTQETLDYIVKHKCSICRFGDGEFEMIFGKNMSFQKFDQNLSLRLREVLTSTTTTALRCLPNLYGSLAEYTREEQDYWRGCLSWSRARLLTICVPKMLFGDAEVTRPYINRLNKLQSVEYYGCWKQLFWRKKILIVEGRYTRMGVGNDLFADVESVRRIWCPPTNAWERYDEILSIVLRHAEKDDLILLALGAVATVLAYDLNEKGFWTLDVGHLDVEYMWMKMGAISKVPIPGRYVNKVIMNGREMVKFPNEEKELNVVASIGI